MNTAWVCAYCSTANPPGSKACQACGAPLSAPPPIQKVPPLLHPVSPPPVDPKTLAQVRESGEKVEKVVKQGMYWYAVLWRTLAEAFAIALGAAVLGIIAGGLETWWLGVLTGITLGVVVGASNKPYWLAAISAPAGVILGAAVWLPLWLITGQLWGMLLTASAGGILFAFWGSQKRANNLWENLRPFLGAAGGLLFAAFGALLTQGLVWLIKSSF